MFKKYHKRINNAKIDFYDWLIENTDYIQDYPLIRQIYNLFNLHDGNNFTAPFEHIKLSNGPYNKFDIREILKEDGFIF